MHGQFHRACVCRSILVSKRREKEERAREREEKKRCWVHDSCKPRGHTSPRLAPPLTTLAASFLLSAPPCLPLSVSFLRCLPPPPFGLVLHRESRQRCVPRLTRGTKGRGGNPEGDHGGNDGFAISQRYQLGWLAITLFGGTYVFSSAPVRVPVRSFVRSLVPRVFHVTPDSRMSHGLPALIHPIKFNFKRPARRSTLPAHSPPRGKIDPLNGTD